MSTTVPGSSTLLLAESNSLFHSVYLVGRKRRVVNPF